ncbi:Na+/H+ antiporter subunit E [Compostimonas suwonensis]|uniref:Multicomponent Na+:H+ antiporter subunit E n=1 Tax=Compostimonas suwonensis TaxID=1048394 RepID=A0A2M9BB12_9MICO|nr:Na+/H+ antiporter subunit E [Compostimonas suwonensis]PJJ55133.1 multicomponent Na+:H+ antiporter subunit E [Compostimonas suwonensis]
MSAPQPSQPGSTQPGSSQPASTRSHGRVGVVSQIVLIAGLVVLWMLLWGQFTLLALATGLVLALIVSRVFYLPAVDLSGRVDPWRLLVFGAVLVKDIVWASLDVAFTVLRPRFTPHNAIIGVQLRTSSELIMVWTAGAVSLVPGSIVVEIDRAAAVLYLHVLNVADDADIERARHAVSATERRLVLALGSAADVERVRLGGIRAGDAGDARGDARDDAENDARNDAENEGGRP